MAGAVSSAAPGAGVTTRGALDVRACSRGRVALSARRQARHATNPLVSVVARLAQNESDTLRHDTTPTSMGVDRTRSSVKSKSSALTSVATKATTIRVAPCRARNNVNANSARISWTAESISRVALGRGSAFSSRPDIEPTEVHRACQLARMPARDNRDRVAGRASPARLPPPPQMVRHLQLER